MDNRRFVGALMGGVICAAPHLTGAQRYEARMTSQEVAVMERRIADQLSKGRGEAAVKDGLARDRAVLEKTAPSITASFQQAGYSAAEAESRLAWTWYLLRLGKDSVPVDKELSPAVIQAKAIRLGKLVVNSQPDGASILVDDAKWPAGTNSEGFADIGRRRIRVERAGMQPAEGACDVARDRVATFVATLQTSGSKAECK